MATLDERVTALVVAGATGQGGGTFSHRVLDRIAAQAVQDILRSLTLLLPRLSRRELIAVLAGRLNRHVVTAWHTGFSYGQTDAGLAGAGPTYLPNVPAGYELWPDDFAEDDPTRDMSQDEEPERLDAIEHAVRVIMERPPAAQSKDIERLAFNETVEAAQKGYQTAGARGGVGGYRRRINPDACQLCFWLWKGGYVYPIDQPMHRHTGCRCYPEFTTDRPGRFRGSDEELQARALIEQRFLEIYPSKNSPAYRAQQEETREQREQRRSGLREGLPAASRIRPEELELVERWERLRAGRE